MTPRNLKQALENGYVFKAIQYKGTNKCRVDVTPRFYRNGMPAILSFWMDNAYVRRTYPNQYKQF